MCKNYFLCGYKRPPVQYLADRKVIADFPIVGCSFANKEIRIATYFEEYVCPFGIA